MQGLLHMRFYDDYDSNLKVLLKTVLDVSSSTTQPPTPSPQIITPPSKPEPQVSAPPTAPKWLILGIGALVGLFLLATLFALEREFRARATAFATNVAVLPTKEETARPTNPLPSVTLRATNASPSVTPNLPNQVPAATETAAPTESPSPTATLRPPNTPTLLPAASAIQKFGTDNAEMVFVPAGEFTMGSRDDASGAESDEKPAHPVSLDTFWVDRYEVTNAQYKLCVDAGKCQLPRETKSYTHNPYFGEKEFDNYPVIYVSWNDAQAYCAWADKRLPTEAEWEKAARGVDERVYPWGDTFEQSRLNSGSVVGDTTQVEKYPSGASPYGALDMVGNVWEWVADWYDENYYKNSPAQNPTRPASGQSRVLRGGAWHSNIVIARGARRGWIQPGRMVSNNGFRCARSFS